MIRCVCGKKIGPDPRNFNQRVSLGRNDLLIRTFLSAYQILELMKKYNPNAKPATVYRSLDYLQQAGIIVKIECCSKFIKKNNLSSDVVTIFLICSNCGTIIQHTDHLIHTYIEKKAIDYGCAVQKKDIEVKVICPDCRGKG
ncbi:transcriptional repressor [Klebsiella pneumoniae]|uniref:Fur family transcriptional regulator n=3 Tax=Klebsiella pneumoniae TaxID=573 RepID=UPI0031FE7BCA